MASNNASKITKDTPARKNTRVGSIQSAVEAAAMKESHDYFVTRLTEGYKQQLETMEQGYEEQIRELKAQFAATVGKAKEDATKGVLAKAARENESLQADIHILESEKRQTAKKLRLFSEQGQKAGEKIDQIEAKYTTQIAEQRKKHEAELDKAQRENNSGPYRWIEVKFARKLKTKKGDPRPVVRRGSTKFSELMQAATFLGKTPDSWVYEYRGRQVSDTSKTLSQLGFKEGEEVLYYEKPS